MDRSNKWIDRILFVVRDVEMKTFKTFKTVSGQIYVVRRIILNLVSTSDVKIFFESFTLGSNALKCFK